MFIQKLSSLFEFAQHPLLLLPLVQPHEVIELLIVLAALWVWWCTTSRQWQRRLRLPFACATVVLVLVSPVGFSLGLWGLTVPLPPDSGKPVDAIVILGRGQALRQSRLTIAQQLWQTGRAPRIFASGMLDARVMIQILKEAGVPENTLSGEECSQSTQENALFTSAILRPQHIQTIVLVTDSPHMLRALLTFRSFGFEVIAHSSPISGKVAPLSKLALLGREYFALAKYGLSQQLQSRSAQVLDHPPTEVRQRIRDWKCQV